MASSKVLEAVNTAKKPNTVWVKRNGHRFWGRIENITKIEEDFCEYPGGPGGHMIVRKDYKFTFSDGTWYRINRPTLSLNNPHATI